MKPSIWWRMISVISAAFGEKPTLRLDLETVITDLLDGQYNNPVRVIGFNTAEGWSRDVSEDVAHEIRRRCDLRMTDPSPRLESFIEQHERGDRRQLTLRLV
jgi:hypothetical protein